MSAENAAKLVTLGCSHCVATRDECERRMVNIGQACCRDCEHPIVREQPGVVPHLCRPDENHGSWARCAVCWRVFP